MNKKDYLLRLLSLLDTDDPVINGLMVLISQEEITTDILDYFIDVFQNYAKTLKTREEQEKVQKAIQFVEKMKETEQVSQKEDQARLSELDTMLETL
jgi:hypothetical protein